MQPRTRLVCAYVMTSDSGHAPNPFHDVCTLAICTPNHRRSRSKPGDWMIGLTGVEIRKKLGDRNIWRLVYAMHIDKKLDLDAYYRDPLFSAKIPKLNGSVVERVGDNFYRKDSLGRLSHTRETDEHRAPVPGTEIEKQDIDGNRVFAGQSYWYFGGNAPALPRGRQWVERLIAKFTLSARGIRYAYEDGAEVGNLWSDADLADFIAWLPASSGCLGNQFTRHKSTRRMPNVADVIVPGKIPRTDRENAAAPEVQAYLHAKLSEQ